MYCPRMDGSRGNRDVQGVYASGVFGGQVDRIAGAVRLVMFSLRTET